MIAATTTGPLTFDDFELLPDPEFGVLELREGVVVTMPPPKKGHAGIEKVLLRLLESRIGESWYGATEFGCRIGNRSYLIPDIVITTAERWKRTPFDEYFEGSPEFVVEILSPSNTVSELDQKRELYFAHGCQEFWVINPEIPGVTVFRADSTWHFYHVDQSIPLALVDAPELPVRLIFES